MAGLPAGLTPLADDNQDNTLPAGLSPLPAGLTPLDQQDSESHLGRQIIPGIAEGLLGATVGAADMLTGSQDLSEQVQELNKRRVAAGQQPVPEIPTGMSLIESGLGYFGLDPRSVQANTLPEKLVRGASQSAAGFAIPFGGEETTLANIAKGVGLGAVAGTAGTGISQYVPDQYKDSVNNLVQLATGLVGGALLHNPSEAGTTASASTAEAPAPHSAAPQPGAVIGLKFPDAPSQRGVVDHYFDSGNSVRVRFDDGTVHDMNTPEFLSGLTEPPAPMYETEQFAQYEPITQEESFDLMGPYNRGQPPGPRTPELNPDMTFALDRASALESAAIDRNINLSTIQREDMLREAGSLRRQFGAENLSPTQYQHPLAGQDMTGPLFQAAQEGPTTYQHPLAGEPDLLELAQGRVENPQLFGQERIVPEPAPAQPELPQGLTPISQVPRDKSLLATIQAMGGIKTRAPNGDLTREGSEINAVLKDYRRPGLINNKSGLPADTVRELLQEQGWFGRREDQGADIQDLYDLIGREAQGEKIFHPESQKNQPQVSKEEEAYRLRELQDRAEALGIQHAPNATHEDLLEAIAAHENRNVSSAPEAEAASDHIETNLDPSVRYLDPLDRMFLEEHGYEDHPATAEQQEAFGAQEAGVPEEAGARETEGTPVGENTGAGGELTPQGYQAEAGAEGKPQLVMPGMEGSQRQLLEAELARREGRGKAEAKAAQKPANEGLFAPEAPPPTGKLFEQAQEAAPTFYSALTRGVENVQTKKASPKDWIGMIDNMPGVKKEEIDWSGIKDWLRGRTAPVTKDELLQRVRENEVQVQEVVRGKVPDHDDTVPDQQAQDEYGERWDAINQKIRDKQAEIDRRAGPVSPADLRREYERLQDARDELHDQMVADTRRRAMQRLGISRDTKPPKYGQYTLPGGENYRELLLTLPQKRGLPSGWSVREFENKGGHLTHEVIDDEGNQRGIGTSAEDAINDMWTGNPPGKVNFTSGHWNEPNILAHVRFDDRTGPNGEKILHMAEVQSDWHQQGRRQGYRTELTPEDKAKIADLRAQGKEAGKAVERADVARWKALNEDKGTPASEMMALEQAHERAVMNHLRIMDEIGTIERKAQEGVPQAPFKTSWHELALKRMLRYAAEHGYDKLSWDTGATNAERYDLSKSVKAVYARKIDGGRYAIDVVGHDGEEVALPRRDFNADQLADTVGKELADKIVKEVGEPLSPAEVARRFKLIGTDIPLTRAEADELGALNRRHEVSKIGKEYTGDDLKVGGEGMRGFYDKILPAAANKLGKKFGTKVEEGAIARPRQWNIYDGGQYISTVEDPAVAQRFQDKDYEVRQVGGQQIKTHSIPITPAMREGVMRGQPMFQRERYEGEMTPHGLSQQLIPGHDVTAIMPEAPNTYEQQVMDKIGEIAKRIVPSAEVIPARRIEIGNEMRAGTGTRQGLQTSGLSYIAPERSLIAWALNSRGHVDTIQHEAVHYLRQTGLLTPREWGVLAKTAERENWIAKHQIDDRYPNLERDRQIEESVAEQFGAYRRGESPVPKALQPIYEKIMQFLDQVREYLQNTFGVDATPEQIFARMESGRIGQRAFNPSFDRQAITSLQNEERPILPPEGKDYLDETAEAMADHLKTQPPGTMARDLRRMETQGNRYADPGWMKRNAIGARTLAETDTLSAKIWNAYKRLNAEYQSRLSGLRDPIAPTFLKLSTDSQNKVYAAEEIARLNNMPFRDTGYSIVARNDKLDKAALSKPGEAVKLTPQETKAYFERQAMFRKAWDGIMEGSARRLGWDAPWKPVAEDNIKDIQSKLSAATSPREKKFYQRLFDTMQAMEEQRKQAYVPLMRFGDYYASVTKKRAAPVPGEDDLGGFPKVEHFQLAERPHLKDFDPRNRGLRQGEVPDYAQPMLADLKEKFPEDKFNIEHGWLSRNPDALRNLDIPAVEKLLTLTEGGVMRDLIEQEMLGGRANKKDARARASAKFSAMYEQALEAVRDEMYSKLKAGFKQRSNAVPGYTPDFHRVTGSYMNWVSRHTADAIHGDALEQAHNNLEQQHPMHSVREFWRQWRHRMDSPTSPMSRVSNAMNQAGFMYSLALNPASMAIISLHGPMMGMPTLSTGIGMRKAFAGFNRAYGDAISSMRGDFQKGMYVDPEKLGKTPDEKSFLRQLAAEDELRSKGTDDIRSMGHQWASMWGEHAPLMRKVADISSSNIAVMDQANRAAMALSAYRLAKDPKTLAKMDEAWKGNEVWRAMSRDMDGTPRKVTPSNMARFLLSQGVGEWGQEARSQFGSEPIGRMATALHGFQIRFMSNLAKQMMNQGPAGKQALLWTLAALWVGAGVEGIPFTQDLENLGDYIYKKITGKDPMLHYRMRALVADTGLGKVGAEMVMHGPVSTLTGVDLGSRIGFGDVVSRDAGPLLALAGLSEDSQDAALTFPSIVANAAHAGGRGMLPTVAKSVLAGAAEKREGVKSQSGRTTYLRPDQITARQQAIRMTGFKPMEEYRARERQEYNYRARHAKMKAPEMAIPNPED